MSNTAIAQPAIIAASLAAMRVLQRCGIEAEAAVGHSLGELAALCWGGAIAEGDLVALAAARGHAMAGHAHDGGGMIRVVADRMAAAELATGLTLAIACENLADEVVLSGALDELQVVESRARASGIACQVLAVSHAFHSPRMAPAVPVFASALEGLRFERLSRRVFSTVTGDQIAARDDLRVLLLRQLEAPVQFAAALRRLVDETQLLIEVGPGAGLSRLARRAGAHALPVDAFGTSLEPLLAAIGAAFVAGAQVDAAGLLGDRPVRPINIARRPSFLSSPCGRRGEPRRGEAETVMTNPPEPACPAVTPDVPVTHGADAFSVVRSILAARTGLPEAGIARDQRLLDDLHLSSLAVARVVTDAVRALELAAPHAPTEFSSATVGQLASTLDEWRAIPVSEGAPVSARGVAPWVRTYGVEWRRADATEGRREPIAWTVVIIGDLAPSDAAPPVGPEAEASRGLLVWITAAADHTASAQLLDTCQHAWRDPAVRHLAICHVNAPVSSFARSIALEDRFASVRVIERGAEWTAEAISRELAEAVDGFAEVRLEPNGTRWTPVFVATCGPAGAAGPIITAGLGASPRPRATVTGEDVVLVTGGAKGIASECAVRLARRTGARIALVGRSAPQDPAVAAALQRLERLGVRFRYGSADVADAAAMAAFVEDVTREFGPVTTIVHAAGLNEPASLATLTAGDMAATLKPKIDGLRVVVDVAGPSLRRLITFGSIIGRMGLAGEAHYALANAWQTRLTEQIGSGRPDVSVLALEWSIWSGTGMGERIGAIDRLAAEGVTALSVDQALDAFERLAIDGCEGSTIVTGRFGPPRFVDVDAAQLPLLRFVDRPLVHFPQVELVVETELSLGRDPYLVDHRVDGDIVVPAVMALEAMAQVAASLRGSGAPTGARDVRFVGAVTLPSQGSRRIRIAALSDGAAAVLTAIFADDDAFRSPRVLGTLIFESAVQADTDITTPSVAAALPACGVDGLYGSLFFHGRRFRRISRYTAVSARVLCANLDAPVSEPWFGAYEPPLLLLGDASARDAMMHALQVAVPDRRVLPVRVERIAFHSFHPVRRVEAIERDASTDTFVFDIVARGDGDVVVEEWRGTRFRAIGESATDPGALAPALAAPHLERMARATLADTSIQVAVVDDGAVSRDVRRTLALAALGLAGQVVRRPDGRPEVIDGMRHVSLAHVDGLTLAVAAARCVACDVVEIAAFRDLNEPTGLTSASEDRARAWAVMETCRKLGRQHTNDATADDLVSVVTSIGARRVAVAIGAGAARTIAAARPPAAATAELEP